MDEAIGVFLAASSGLLVAFAILRAVAIAKRGVGAGL